MDTNALIQLVKEYPLLYTKNDSSINIDQKNMLWKEIASRLNQPEAKCKSKWRNLRDSYQKALRWKSELEEMGKLCNYHPYRHEAALSFLENKMKRKREDGDRSKK